MLVSLESLEEVKMSVVSLYRNFRNKFPELTMEADRHHVTIWDVVEEDSAYVWFESLAKAVNDRMSDKSSRARLVAIFEFFESQFSAGDDQVKNCIDVSFVENLFWEVRTDAAKRVWSMMPNALQELYLGFHGRPPASR